MKKILITAIISMIAAVMFPACDKNNNDNAEWYLVDRNGYTSFDCPLLNDQINTAPVQAISDVERESLIFMREEEKLARDVYLKLNETWNAQVFDNISSSEATHMCAILNLLNRYSIPDPVGDNGIGVFNNDVLQGLYTAMIETGNTSLIDALKVGAAIEEIDIRDLDNALLNIDNADIQFVYENLMAASRNHLRAFVKNLDLQGVTYVPQYLTQAEYNQIINADMETGPKRKGW